jgi:GNAT superfamily N-acetyltransferase
MVNIEVRLATPSDSEFLVHGNAEMALETEQLSLDFDRLRDGVHAVFENPARGVYFVATVGTRRAGMMLLTYEWSDWRNGAFWWIQSVFVEPDLRSQGVFKAIYRHVEGLAKATPGVAGLRLFVENHNVRAQNTYQSVGMKRTAYQVFETDFILKRE